MSKTDTAHWVFLPTLRFLSLWFHIFSLRISWGLMRGGTGLMHAACLSAKPQGMLIHLPGILPLLCIERRNINKRCPYKCDNHQCQLSWPVGQHTVLIDIQPFYPGMAMLVIKKIKTTFIPVGKHCCPSCPRPSSHDFPDKPVIQQLKGNLVKYGPPGSYSRLWLHPLWLVSSYDISFVKYFPWVQRNVKIGQVDEVLICVKMYRNGIRCQDIHAQGVVFLLKYLLTTVRSIKCLKRESDGTQYDS